MSLDRTPEQKRLREKEKWHIARMKRLVNLRKEGRISTKKYWEAFYRFTDNIKVIHEKEEKLGMDLWTIDLS